MFGSTPRPDSWALDHPESAATSRRNSRRLLVGLLAGGLLFVSAAPVAASPISGYKAPTQPISGY